MTDVFYLDGRLPSNMTSIAALDFSGVKLQLWRMSMDSSLTNPMAYSLKALDQHNTARLSRAYLHKGF